MIIVILAVHTASDRPGKKSAQLLPIVVLSGVDYLKPAFMDDIVTVETRLIEARGASLDLEQCVLRGEQPLVTAKVLVASLANGRPTRLPEKIVAALADPRRGRGSIGA